MNPDTAEILQTEDGLGEIDCDKLPLVTSFAEAMSALSSGFTASFSIMEARVMISLFDFPRDFARSWTITSPPTIPRGSP